MAKSPRIDLRPGVTEPVVLMISRREVEAKDLLRHFSTQRPDVQPLKQGEEVRIVEVDSHLAGA